MPANEEIEASVIATLITQPESLDAVGRILAPDCFYNDKYRYVYNSIVSLREKCMTASILSIANEMTASGMPMEAWELSEMSKDYDFESLKTHCKELVEFSQRRSILMLAMQMAVTSCNLGYDVTKIFRDAISAIDDASSRGNSHIHTAGEVAIDYHERLMKRMKDENYTDVDTPTGFSYLDKHGGFQKGDLVVVAGATSQGKTSLVTTIAMNAMQTKKMAYYSLEMSKERLVERVISAKSKVPKGVVSRGIPRGSYLTSIETAVDNIVKCGDNLIFDDNSKSNLDSIISSIRELKRDRDIDGVIVDYVQILTVNSKEAKDEKMLAESARKFQSIAKELNIWVCILSQLNRDKDHPEPSIDRLRGSGQLADAADIVLLVYRPKTFRENDPARFANLTYPKPYQDVSVDGTAMVTIAKGRDIGTGSFICGFDEETTCFYELEDEPDKEKHAWQKNKNEQLPF